MYKNACRHLPLLPHSVNTKVAAVRAVRTAQAYMLVAAGNRYISFSALTVPASRDKTIPQQQLLSSARPAQLPLGSSASHCTVLCATPYRTEQYRKLLTAAALAGDRPATFLVCSHRPIRGVFALPSLLASTKLNTRTVPEKHA